MYRSTKEYSNNIYFVFSTYFWNLYQFLELKWKQKKSKNSIGPSREIGPGHPSHRRMARRARGGDRAPRARGGVGSRMDKVWRGRRREHRRGKGHMPNKEVAVGTHPRTASMVRGGGAEVAARWRSTAMTHLVHEREVRHDFNVDGKIGWVGLTMRGRWLAFGFTKKCLFTMETRWKSIFHSCEAHIMSQIDTSVLYKKVYGF
jgi:hypothetical protein